MFWITFVVLMDQLSKMLIERFLTIPTFVVPGLLWFSYTKNTGIAFGMFARSPWVVWVTFFATFFLALVPRFVKCSALTTVGLQMIVGGAIGNVIDRFRLGYVVDFINLRYFPAVFNVADLFITIGGILVLVSLLRGEPSLDDKGEQE
ncbi:MAG: Lipoprotein signal peptidase [Thermotoga sp. 50_1627]|uniref:signal peptidase II n=1 Tax=Pseudothermotoga sp. TaxID=2033661 RepID=UPI00076D97A4|nr:MAG: Lipoprotein signal peptidase [Thermotoga sp. 50_64]KUK25980.1 MAG: Lipoprotein signal peptidase [Thermotoga sp. 50_1627]MBC7116037.1 signal peptidase II [Pseudothermotoga sp.]MDK2922669.1 signal peptidase [Pseudothermotoga sp.]HBT38643.1 signal peptidase II [Pseudothermotoga sp.]